MNDKVASKRLDKESSVKKGSDGVTYAENKFEGVFGFLEFNFNLLNEKNISNTVHLFYL